MVPAMVIEPTDAARRVLSDDRRARQRVAAEAYAQCLRQRSPEEIEADRVLIETSNDEALRGAEW